MQRSIVIVLLVLLTVGIAAAGVAWQRGTPTITPTEAACQMVEAYSTANLQVELAIDTLYEGLPMMKTPIAMVMVATQDKPFTVGCLGAGD